MVAKKKVVQKKEVSRKKTSSKKTVIDKVKKLIEPKLNSFSVTQNKDGNYYIDVKRLKGKALVVVGQDNRGKEFAVSFRI